jgi:hypothetical protein
MASLQCGAGTRKNNLPGHVPDAVKPMPSTAAVSGPESRGPDGKEGSRLQGTKSDGRLKTTTSWVRHRLHAWEEDRKRRGVAQICIWATPLGWQH